MEFLGVIATKIVESLVAPVGQWLSECTIAPVGECLGYSFHHSSNIENLKKQKNELKDNRERVQHLVDGAIRNAEEIEADVNSWLEKVDLIMENAEQVLEDEEKANTRCSNGTCLNLKQRHQQKVANQVKGNKLFDDVAIAEVTQSLDLRRIQEELAGMLDLKFDIVEPVTVRARRLCQRLTTMHNKILVILDRNSCYGLQSSDNMGENRNKDLLSCEMGTQKNFGLGVLTEEEAWNLFEKMAGDSVKDPNLRSTATEVAKECAGLPIALVTVSKALKDKSLYEWKDALKQLRRPGHLSQMQSTIYSSIELSCSHLESEEAKTFFLLCSESGYIIGYLDMLKYCYGWGLFPNINTLEEARNRLHREVRNLRDSSLLLDCPNTHEHFHMHDVVRDAAILIASKDEHNIFLVSDDRELKQLMDMDALKRCMALSISGIDIHELPNEMECPELRFLCVNGGDKSLQIIPETFFDGMRKLKVLDFTQMKLSSLPSSLHLLSNLTTLCLDFCAFEDMAVIGELKNLEILSLVGSNVSQLPREIGLLTHLRLLDLRKCSKLEVIPRNVLSSLVELEELYMGNSFDHWETEGLDNGRNNATLAELMHLSHLVTLEIHIRDASVLPKDLLLFKKLERYRICVGDVWDWAEKHETSRRLKLKLNTRFQLECRIKMLLNGVEDLWLDELKGVKSILYELDTEGFQQLKHLHVQNNAEIKYIISSVWLIVFPALETFSLKNMINLEEICHGQLHSKSFGNLRVVKFKNCNKLKFVFSLSIAKELSQLRELEIRECSIMGAIVIKAEPEIEVKEIDMTLFPQLRVLTVQHLPKLVSFFSTQNSFITNVGEITPEGEHDFSMPILHEQVVFPSLERLELSSISEEIQHNQHQTRSSCKLTNMQASMRFQNLLTLEMNDFGSLKYLLPFSTARLIVQLKHLHISECKVMEEILLTEDLGG
ncbi:probable disease resistance protein At4g27220 [Fagus crenata]